MGDSSFDIEEVSDGAQVARFRARDMLAKRNSAWLQAHWSELLPNARGKFLAVSGEQAFLGDSAEEAWRQAKVAHPADDGALLQYVLPGSGPRFYANRG
jgi:hypothetical protein